MVDVGVPVSARLYVIDPAAVPPPEIVIVAVPPKSVVPAGAGVSLATFMVAIQVATGAVVSSLHATPMTATSIACNPDIRIASPLFQVNVRLRSEERRVGKECRSRRLH